MVAGVAAGLADYFDVDPTLVRDRVRRALPAWVDSPSPSIWPGGC